MINIRDVEDGRDLTLTIDSQLQEAAGSATRVNLSENVPNFNPAADTKYWTANVGLNASRVLDFWGRYRRGVESASANLGSQIGAYDS